jgi:WD40 repeat protein
VSGLALAQDGRTLASRCTEGSIFLWDLTKPSRHLGYQTLPRNLSPAVFAPDSQSILGDDESNGVALWDPHTLKETRRLWGATTNWNFFSPDARWVLRSDGQDRLNVWDVNSGLETTNFITLSGALAEWPPRFTDNGKFLTIRYGRRNLDTNTVLEVWDTVTWQRKGSLALNFNHVVGWPGGFTPSLPNSYMVDGDDALRFFDVTKLNEASKLIPSPNGIYGLAASPDGQMAVGAYADGSVRFWDMTTLNLVESIRGFLLAARSVAFSPDGRRLAVSSTGAEGVKLWDTGTRQELLTLSGEGVLGHVKFSPDGRCLMALNQYGLVHLWTAPTLDEINADEAKEKTQTPQP